MKKNEKKIDFIQARAMGFSLSKTAKKLGVSLASCKKWEKEFKTDVDETRAAMEEDAAQAFGLVRAARLEAVGATLQKIRRAVKRRMDAEAEEIPLAKLLEAQIKFEAMAKEMDAETREKTTPAMILAHLEAVKNGNAPAIEQTVLMAIKDALDQITPTDRPETVTVDIDQIRKEAEALGVYG